MVATAVPGVRTISVTAKQALVVGIDDPAALVAATARLLAEPQLRTAMVRRRAKRCVARFSLTAVRAAGWLSVLQPLLRPSRL